MICTQPIFPVRQSRRMSDFLLFRLGSCSSVLLIFADLEGLYRSFQDISVLLVLGHRLAEVMRPYAGYALCSAEGKSLPTTASLLLMSPSKRKQTAAIAESCNCNTAVYSVCFPSCWEVRGRWGARPCGMCKRQLRPHRRRSATRNAAPRFQWPVRGMPPRSNGKARVAAKGRGCVKPVADARLITDFQAAPCSWR